MRPAICTINSGEKFFGFCRKSSRLLCYGTLSPGVYTPGGQKVGAINVNTLPDQGMSEHMWTIDGVERFVFFMPTAMLLAELDFSETQ